MSDSEWFTRGVVLSDLTDSLLAARQPVSRSSSGVSQQRAAPSPVAAEAHFQRVTFAPTMTVMSGPVPPPGSVAAAATVVVSQPYWSYPVRQAAPPPHWLPSYAPPDAVAWAPAPPLVEAVDLAAPPSPDDAAVYVARAPPQAAALVGVAPQGHVTQLLPVAAQMTPVCRTTPLVQMASVSQKAPVPQMTPVSQQMAAPVGRRPSPPPPVVTAATVATALPVEPQSPTMLPTWTELVSN